MAVCLHSTHELGLISSTAETGYLEHRGEEFKVSSLTVSLRLAT